VANEKDLKIRIPVVPELDKRAVATLRKDVAALSKELNKINIDYKVLAKTSQVNAKELQNMSDGAKSLGDNLAEAAKKATTDIDKTTKQIERVRKKAEQLQKKSAKAGSSGDAPAQEQADADYGRVSVALSKLEDQLLEQKKTAQQFNTELKRGVTHQRNSNIQLRRLANYDPSDALGGIFSGIKSVLTGGGAGGLGTAATAAARGVGGHVVRSAGGGPGGGGIDPAMLSTMGKAMGALTVAAGVIGGFVQLLLAASENTSKLNKALAQGIPLAGDMGLGIGVYIESLKNMRQAAMKSGGAMIQYGYNTEEALKMVNQYAKESTGSIEATERRLSQWGGGGSKGVEKGLLMFTKNAQMYGKALGMTGEETASMMGNMVSEIGISGDNVMSTMGDIVRQAAAAGMPTHKFMDIFREAIPNLDLFTNRIEELTGTIKMLSKTMDPRAIKGFMQAFSQGFDQMDFKQRLKMIFVVGPGKMSKLLQRGVNNASKNLGKQMPGLAKSMAKALKGADPINAMRKLAGEAMATGEATGAQVMAMNKMARMQELGRGGPLKMAGAMRDMGFSERMEALELHAGALTGGDISGLGEHVAKSLGVSEAEYKAIIAMKDAMGNYMSQASSIGRTSDLEMNNSLKEQFSELPHNLGKTMTDGLFEAEMKSMAKHNPKTLEQMIKKSAIEQTEADLKKASDEEAGRQSMEELTIDHTRETQSISDKITNIIQVLLQKLYVILEDVFQIFQGLYDYLPDWISGKNDDDYAQMDALLNKNRKNYSAVDVRKAEELRSNLKDMDKKDLGTKLASGLTLQFDKDGVATKESKDLIHKQFEGVFHGVGTRDLYGSMSESIIQSLEAKQAGKQHVNIEDILGGLNKDVLSKMLFERGSVGFGVDSRAHGPELALAEIKKREDNEVRDKRLKNAQSDSKATSDPRSQKLYLEMNLAKLRIGELNDVTKEQIELAEVALVAAEKEIKVIEDKEAAEKEAAQVTAELADNALKAAAGLAAVPAAWDKYSAPATSPASSVAGTTGTTTPGAPNMLSFDSTNMSLEEKTEELITVTGSTVVAADKTADLLNRILDKGIKFDDGWMNSSLKGMLNKVVFDNVSEALLNYALLTDPEAVKSKLAELKAGGHNIQGATHLGKELQKNLFASGGYTGNGPTSQPAGIVHKGEFVVPQKGALVSGGAGKTVNVGTVNIHIQTNDPNEIRRVVDDIFNQGH